MCFYPFFFLKVPLTRSPNLNSMFLLKISIDFSRFNRGGFQQRDNFHGRRRRSPSRSPGFRGRNRNARRSRSASYDRFRNRRNSSNSRERSSSQGRRENSRPPLGGPQAPPAPNFPSDYAPTHFQPEYQPPYPSAPQYGNYDYVPIMQAPPTSFPPYPPPTTQEYMWNTQIPPPPIISCAAPPEPAPVPTKPATNEQDEEQQKRQGIFNGYFLYVLINLNVYNQ